MSLFGKPGFEEAAVGWMPSDWSIEQVATLANVDPESLSNKTAPDFSFRYISLGDVDAGKLTGDYSPITFAEAPSRARRIVKSGDILFATVRPNLKGHFFARRIDGNVVASTGFAVIRARDGIASPAFIYQSLLSSNVDVQIEKLTVGSNYPAVNSADIKGLVLPTPPLPEQQKIAAILTAVDDKLDVIARQIEATQTLKQGLIQTLFSRGVGTQDASGRWASHAEQKTTALGMLPASWVVEPLDRHVSKVGSGITPKGGSTSYQSSGVPLIRSQNVLVGRLSLDDVAYIDEVQHNRMRNSALEPEDVLLNITGASIGRCAVLPRDFSEGNVNQHVCIIRTLPSLAPQFLCQYINSSFGQKQVAKFQAGGNREGLNYQQVRSFDVPVPSVGEQEKIVDLLEAVDGKVRCLERKQMQYQALKRGLMQKLLTGEWRVKVDADMAA